MCMVVREGKRKRSIRCDNVKEVVSVGLLYVLKNLDLSVQGKRFVVSVWTR